MLLKIYNSKKEQNKKVYILSMCKKSDNVQVWTDYYIKESVFLALADCGVKVKRFDEVE